MSTDGTLVRILKTRRHMNALASIDPPFRSSICMILTKVRSSAPKIATAKKRTAEPLKARTRAGVKGAAVAKDKKATDAE
jgi:hypothetical protein